eukprot:CAMPEP_0172526636 /NCGR_PEP_ID=MMETSP1067-20121228/1505_1 /TAXON_ID=265564 ORGANISM="Thalassiosira punctigera, Strain Tpunct2005C2" /NCGR_SAMPLE_ID=MMETSP1067 /ASSEMBLY_ACC=CAM_ASM_000444 /LENGTH=153 /DNA_ID=CAMNT_0013310183 /DNA_START=63 /DNA_END=524 /DNA_ORIENTATION=-
MVFPRPASLLAALLAASSSSAAAGDRPPFVGTARVKQHRHRTGDLVEGEEHLLKAIIKWDHVPGAEEYELCHECDHIDETTGEEDGAGPVGGEAYPVEVGHTCGGLPCNVMPGIPQGHNKFHLRVKKGGEWSLWSEYQNFDVKESGTFGHTEL